MTGRIRKTKDEFQPRMNADDTEQRRNLTSALIRVHLCASAAKTAVLFASKCVRMHPHASGCIYKCESNDQSHRISGDSPRFPKIPHPRRSPQRITIEQTN